MDIYKNIKFGGFTEKYYIKIAHLYFQDYYEYNSDTDSCDDELVICAIHNVTKKEKKIAGDIFKVKKIIKKYLEFNNITTDHIDFLQVEQNNNLRIIINNKIICECNHKLKIIDYSGFDIVPFLNKYIHLHKIEI